MIKDDISAGYILALSGSGQYKNSKELYIRKHTTIELLSADSAILRKYTSGGKLCWIKQYAGNKLDGKCIEYSGDIVSEANYKAGERDGKSKIWADGVLIYEDSYKAGRLHGKGIKYDLYTKRIIQIDHYKNGEWLGFECYDSKGKCISKWAK